MKEDNEQETILPAKRKSHHQEKVALHHEKEGEIAIETYSTANADELDLTTATYQASEDDEPTKAKCCCQGSVIQDEVPIRSGSQQMVHVMSMSINMGYSKPSLLLCILICLVSMWTIEISDVLIRADFCLSLDCDIGCS